MVAVAGCGSTTQRVLLLTPARDEARLADRLVDGVLAQTRPPDRWVIVDDGSGDGTLEAFARRVGGLPWVTLLRREPCGGRAVRDGLAAAADARALNWALARVDRRAYSHIGKLDADVVLPPHFLATLLGAFAADPALGMAGGMITERHGRAWRRVRQPPTHAPPLARLYSRPCFEACGGFRERLGWDTIDEVYARMRGFSTRLVPGAPVRHLRAHGSADGRLRGCARHGACAWIAHYPPVFVLLRALKVGATFSPRGFSGLAFASGYLAAGCRGAARVEDPAFRRFIRAELRARLGAAAPGGRGRAAAAGGT
jgi:biofilm PGA synthesis N-glycosyltransferase PgaC